MTKLKDLIPEESKKLVNYSGKDLIDRLGKDIIDEVVLSILKGDNLRSLTEGLTQRRILLMNASMVVTYIKAFSSYDDFTNNLSQIVAKEVKSKTLTSNEKSYLYWFLGLTGKSIQNVLRDDTTLEDYLSEFDNNLKEIAADVEAIYGPLNLTLKNSGINCLMNWPSLLRCLLAVGAQTLSIRGSEKSMYGKLFEKFVLGSVLSMLGFEYINKNDTSKTKMVFWLSERADKRESDATILLKAGSGARFDIGFIGKGNPEISLDKVSRFERQMERGGTTYYTTTIILIDTLGKRSRTQNMANNLNGHVIQMSGTYWVYELANILKKEFPFYSNPLENLTQDQSLKYLEEHIKNINLSSFLSQADVASNPILDFEQE